MKHPPALLIRKKRDGQTLSGREIEELVAGIVDGSLQDAQLGALLMAGYLRGATFEEAACWTKAMRDSGRVYDLSSVAGSKVDKHSTGGVGDKVSLVLAPLVASLGVPVPMVSGRGLGHTGGTVDKLGSIPGFRMDLTPEEFVTAVREVGVAMSAATEDIAPADKRMYAVRDVTATVESIPWITSSILSKKLAEGIDGLVLDVKCGRGAFMQDLTRAEELARALVATAELLGCPARARITAMDQPLGRAVGNALEVRESLECLRGVGPSDLRECVLLLAADMLVFGGVADDWARARELAETALADGRALERFARMVQHQGGDPRILDDPAVLPRAPFVGEVTAERSGVVQSLDAYAVGIAALELGAGRRVATDDVDPAVGAVCLKKAGERVEPGDVLFRVHAPSEAAFAAVAGELAAAAPIGSNEVQASPLLRATVGKAPGQEE